MNPDSLKDNRPYEGVGSVGYKVGTNMIVTFRDGYIKKLSNAQITQYGLTGTMRDTNNKDVVTHIPWEAVKFATEE